jgi:two-component system, OmpR family, heavy metal sensor histidine kinase CusS
MTPALRAPGSIAARLSIVLALVAVAVFSIIGLVLHQVLEHVLVTDEADELASTVAIVQRFVDQVHSPNDLRALSHHLDAARVGGRHHWSVWILEPGGHVVYGEDNRTPQVSPSGDITLPDGSVLTGTRHPLSSPFLNPQAELLVGMDPAPRQQLLRRYDGYNITVCVLGVLVTVLLSIAAARNGLAPLRRLSREAAQIQPASLSSRLSVPADQRELVPLAESFNAALDRVELAWKRLQDFNANVAHELRTPLAIMISGLEVTLSRPRTTAELEEVLASQLEELRSMAAMINDMLFLARSDRGIAAERAQELRLGEVAQHVADYLEATLAEAGHELQISGEALAWGDASLLQRALFNLVTNASRHADPGSPLCIVLQEGDGMARVAVINQGPSVPLETQQRMFDRFWRGESSRKRDGAHATETAEHFGLGLAIVRAIAGMHGGEPFVQSADGVTTVGFTLQRAAPDIARMSPRCLTTSSMTDG